MLSVRISSKGSPMGIISLHECEIQREWTLEETRFMEATAAQISVAISHSLLMAQQRRAQRKIARRNKELNVAREKAEAERAAKRAERGETDGDDEGNENRGSRRSRYNNRRDRDDNRKSEEKSETPTSEETTAAELEVIEPHAAADDMAAEGKPARRRKAPARNKSGSDDAEEPTIEAAE